MKKPIVVVHLFAGTGGFELGFQMAGLQADYHYYSEIEKHPIANYKYNFPNAIPLGDVRFISGTKLREQHRNAIIIITFGWPCQDNSIAGKRKGQKHSRKGSSESRAASDTNGLHGRGSHAESLDQAEGESTRSGLLYEANRLIRESKADFFIGENVKGLLFVNAGNDIVESLELLSYLHEGDVKYDVTMQLFNTLFFLPQNRERLYFIGCLTARSRSEILLIREDDKVHNGKKRSGTKIKAGAKYVNEIGVGKTVRTEESKAIRKAAMRQGIDTNPFGAKKLEFRDQNFMNTLTVGNNPDNLIKQPVILGYSRDKDGTVTNYHSKLHAGTIHHSSGKGGNTDQFVVINLEGELKKNQENAACLQKGGKGGGHHSDMDLIAIVDHEGRVKRKEHASTVSAGWRATSNNGDMDFLKFSDYAIRRLTEIECERLQGYPDNWTRYGINAKGQKYEIASTPRFAMVGNGVSSPCVAVCAGIILQEINSYGGSENSQTQKAKS